MRKHWPRPAVGGRLAGSVRANWKPWCGVTAAAALAVTLAPVAATAASARVAPAAATVNVRLQGVTALSATDAWAVGYATPGATTFTQDQALTEHWDGTSWTKVANPALPGSNLAGVSADSATDAWAVGLDYFNTSSGVTTAPLAEHWDGTSGRGRPSPLSRPAPS